MAGCSPKPFQIHIDDNILSFMLTLNQNVQSQQRGHQLFGQRDPESIANDNVHNIEFASEYRNNPKIKDT